MSAVRVDDKNQGYEPATVNSENTEVHMDALTILGIAVIVMLPNIGVAITIWLGNKVVKTKE